jgi:broad specificity phosphatase PhoE
MYGRGSWEFKLLLKEMEQDHDFIDAGLSDEGRIQAFER